MPLTHTQVQSGEGHARVRRTPARGMQRGNAEQEEGKGARALRPAEDAKITQPCTRTASLLWLYLQVHIPPAALALHSFSPSRITTIQSQRKFL